MDVEAIRERLDWIKAEVLELRAMKGGAKCLQNI